MKNVVVINKHSTIWDEGVFEALSKHFAIRIKCQCGLNKSCRVRMCRRNTGHNPKDIHAGRYLLGLGDAKIDKRIADHKNGNALDNRMSNLRIATAYQNKVNRRRDTNRVGYRGVSRVVSRSVLYIGSVCKDRKRYNVGCFKTAREAALAYDKKAVELHGEFAVTNESLGLL